MTGAGRDAGSLRRKAWCASRLSPNLHTSAVSALLLLGVLAFALPPCLAGDQDPSGRVLAPSAGPIAKAGDSQAVDQQPPPPASERPVSLRGLVPNVLRDQKPIWLFPARVVRGEHWKPALGILLVTAGLVALDPHDTPYFRHTSAFADFNQGMSGRNTALGVFAFPLSFYLVGSGRKDSYAKETALLAGEAVADGQFVTLVMKNIGRRLRPSDIPPNGDFTHTWFKSKSSVLGGGQSFPSGHANAAFSVATVFAERYRQRRWVPWVAYGLAGAVAFSRLTLQAHFPSDVFAGAVLGITVSHYVVLRR
jgi:membrane-associated phospholipid phosphatase